MNPQPPNTHATVEPKPKKKQVQPRHHAPKGRLAAALRRKKIIKAVLEGRSATQAGIDSGLSPKTAAAQVTAILKEPETQLTLRTAMEKLGMDDEYLAVKLRALIEGTRFVGTLVPMEVPDNVALAKGIEIACRIKGQFTEKHEVDLKRPVSIIIRKFCTREQPPQEGAPG